MRNMRKLVPLEYSTQKYAVLPKLPVPDANNTLKRFLEFAAQMETRKEFEQTKKVVDNFRDQELPRLQQLLEQRAEKHNNWVS